VFPFHGARGVYKEGEVKKVERVHAAKAAWMSLCRAMRQDPRNVFHAIAIDDTTGHNSTSSWGVRHAAWLAEWRASCDAPNLATLVHIDGERSVGKNLRRGFNWAATLTLNQRTGARFSDSLIQRNLVGPLVLRESDGEQRVDYVMNLDSDMLLTADFFERIVADYVVAQSTCPTPVISGYTSATMDKAYGPNFVFDMKTLHEIVEPLMQLEDRWNGEEKGHAWDSEIGWRSRDACGFWVPRPLASYAQHIVSEDGMHFAQDGELEQARLFVWDPYNWKLARALQPSVMSALRPDSVRLGPRVDRCAPCRGGRCKPGPRSVPGAVALVDRVGANLGKTAGEMCPAFCSVDRYCGSTAAYQTFDCRGCEVM
jgi:hypothetical protein